MSNKIVDENGNIVVVLEKILFKGKRSINWHDVENYAQKYKGVVFRCMGEDIIIDGRFPGEFCWSMDTKRLMGTLAKAKANSIQVVCEMIEVAANKRFQENLDEKHINDARNGWYRYTCRFAIPVLSENGMIERYNFFRTEMVVRKASDGKNYLYDFVNIKKETSKPL